MTKQYLLLIAVFVLAHVPLRAQLIVEDPISIAQDAIDSVVDLAEYVEMVNNQVQQINTMTQELAIRLPFWRLRESAASSLTCNKAELARL